MCHTVGVAGVGVCGIDWMMRTMFFCVVILVFCVSQTVCVGVLLGVWNMHVCVSGGLAAATAFFVPLFLWGVGGWWWWVVLCENCIVDAM